MDLVFKILDSSTLQNATMGSTDFKRYYPEVNINSAWSEVEPYITQATDKYIIPYIGDVYYNALAAKYIAGTTLTTTEAEALRLLKIAAAYYTAMFMYSKKLDISTSIGNIQDTAQSATQTPQWAFRQKLLDLTKTADGALDKLLAFLDKNSLLLTNSKTATFFRTLDEFEEHQDLNGSHKTFRSLRTLINDAVMQFITPILGGNAVAELKTQYNAKTLTLANTTLLPYVQRAAAKYAVALACNMPAYTIEGAYLFAMSSTEGFDGRAENQKLQAESLKNMGDACTNLAHKYGEDLKNFLFKNEANYTTWKTEKYPTTTEKKQTVIISDDSVGGIMI